MNRDFSLKESYIWLNHIRSFRNTDIAKLGRIYGDLSGICKGLFNASEEETKELKDSALLKDETIDEIIEMKDGTWRAKLDKELLSKEIGLTTPEDEDYPERLRLIQDPPKALYYRGDISLTKADLTIGMIGSRRPTFYGTAMAEQFGSELAAQGMVIVSGLALGIDEKSHRAALDSGGKTIAVLGCGVDICYPQKNMNSFLEICEKGLVISEYEPGVPPLQFNFPARNRIISGLSDSLLVVEASLRSGTIITADCALEQGKEVFAIPGRATDALSKGTNNLIKQGATLVDSPIDIVIEMLGLELMTSQNEGGSPVKMKSRDVIRGLSDDEKLMLSNISYDPVYIDDLIRANKMDVGGTLAILRKLEEKKIISKVEQSYYVLAK